MERRVIKVKKGTKKGNFFAYNLTNDYLSEPELVSFVNIINNSLKDDKDLIDIIPISSKSNTSLCEAVKSGILLCKLMNKWIPNSINEDEINTNIHNKFDMIENHNRMLRSAKKIGCKFGDSLQGADLLEPQLQVVLAIVWQIFQIGTIRNFPITILQLNLPEKFFKMKSQEKILTWISLILTKIQCSRRIRNFSNDIKDSEIYIRILNYLNPKVCTLEILSEKEDLIRAYKMIEAAKQLNVQIFVTPKFIIEGNQKLNFLFSASIFNISPLYTLNIDTEHNPDNLAENNANNNNINHTLPLDSSSNFKLHSITNMKFISDEVENNKSKTKKKNKRSTSQENVSTSILTLRNNEEKEVILKPTEALISKSYSVESDMKGLNYYFSDSLTLSSLYSSDGYNSEDIAEKLQRIESLKRWELSLNAKEIELQRKEEALKLKEQSLNDLEVNIQTQLVNSERNHKNNHNEIEVINTIEEDNKKSSESEEIKGLKNTSNTDDSIDKFDKEEINIGETNSLLVEEKSSNDSNNRNSDSILSEDNSSNISIDNDNKNEDMVLLEFTKEKEEVIITVQIGNNKEHIGNDNQENVNIINQNNSFIGDSVTDCDGDDDWSFISNRPYSRLVDESHDRDRENSDYSDTDDDDEFNKLKESIDHDLSNIDINSMIQSVVENQLSVSSKLINQQENEINSNNYDSMSDTTTNESMDSSVDNSINSINSINSSVNSIDDNTNNEKSAEMESNINKELIDIIQNLKVQNDLLKKEFGRIKKKIIRFQRQEDKITELTKQLLLITDERDRQNLRIQSYKNSLLNEKKKNLISEKNLTSSLDTVTLMELRNNEQKKTIELQDYIIKENITSIIAEDKLPKRKKDSTRIPSIRKRDGTPKLARITSQLFFHNDNEDKDKDKEKDKEKEKEREKEKEKEKEDEREGPLLSPKRIRKHFSNNSTSASNIIEDIRDASPSFSSKRSKRLSVSLSSAMKTNIVDGSVFNSSNNASTTLSNGATSPTESGRMKNPLNLLRTPKKERRKKD